ncbi:hypothetical protein NMG60_11008466 [Bertholletia excelsa]
MGCVSSKLFRKDLKEEILLSDVVCTTSTTTAAASHVVSLTSTTYGALKLDQDQTEIPKLPVEEIAEETKKKSSPPRQEPEVINAWELMEDLQEDSPISIPAKKTPKSKAFLRGFSDFNPKTPLKIINQTASPKILKTFGGKENKRALSSPKTAPKASNFRESLRGSEKKPATDVKRRSPKTGTVVSSRRSLGPLFNPNPVEEEEEQVKKVISSTPNSQKPRRSTKSDSVLELFDRKCPPGGENAVVIYTTSLRGIRKTFEDCNKVRSIMESHHVRILERDLSMDLRFKDQVKGLMGAKEVKVPLVFVKGRLIGGAEEVGKLEEEGKLGKLLHGVPGAMGACVGCAGVGFVVCMGCNGSCKVVSGKDKRRKVKCGECNENGLMQCPFCS